MKEKIKALSIRIRGHFYLYEWMKPYVCRYFGHKMNVRYMVYQQERVIKNFNKTEIKLIKHAYDPYYVYSCDRCKKKLGTRKLAQKLSRDEAEAFSKQITLRMRAINEFNKEKKK